MEKYLSRRSRPLRKFPLARVIDTVRAKTKSGYEICIGRFSLCISRQEGTGNGRARVKHGPPDSCHEHRSLSFSLVFIRFLVFRAFSNEAWIRSTRWDPYGARHVRDWTWRYGVSMIKIEKSASLNVIVNRNTGFHSRVSTSGWNRYFSLWRAWLGTACCKIVNVRSQARSRIFNTSWKGEIEIIRFDEYVEKEDGRIK